MMSAPTLAASPTETSCPGTGLPPCGSELPDPSQFQEQALGSLFLTLFMP